MFVGRDGLCHDIYDPNECSGGRRLFYSAFGDPVCDCPLGQYPFPTPESDCVSLLEQGSLKSNVYGNVLLYSNVHLFVLKVHAQRETSLISQTMGDLNAHPATAHVLVPMGFV